MKAIYKIEFQDNSVYVGQTTDFNKRKKSHLARKGEGSPLLEKAFLTNPEPSFLVLEEVENDQDLDSKEIYWIKKLNPNLNVLPGGKSNSGLNSPRLKYTKKQIEEVVNLWRTTGMSATEISHVTGVGYSTVMDVVKKRSHHWATEGINTMEHERTLYWKIWDPEGRCYESNTLEDLSNQTGIAQSTLYSILRSKSGQGKNGWTSHPPQYVNLKSPEGDEVVLSMHQARILLQDSGLSHFSLNQLLNRHKSSAGWKITLCPQKSIDFSPKV